MFSLAKCLPLVLAIALVAPALAADNPAGANSDPTYQQLRNLTLGSESIAVEAIDLKRDAATFHLKSGDMSVSYRRSEGKSQAPSSSVKAA